MGIRTVTNGQNDLQCHLRLVTLDRL